MKHLLVGIVLSFFTLTQAKAADGQFTSARKKTDTITVLGTGVLEVAPDMATVSLTVTTRALSSVDAQNQNAVETKRLTDALIQKYNLEKDQIITTNYTITQEVSPDDTTLITAYVVRHSLSIRVNFVEGLGELLDLAIDSGATSIEYIQFGLINQKSYELESLKLAMQDSRAKAGAIADSVGRTIIRVVKVSEGQYTISSDKEAAQDRAAGTEIFPHLVTITATLTVTYAF